MKSLITGHGRKRALLTVVGMTVVAAVTVGVLAMSASGKRTPPITPLISASALDHMNPTTAKAIKRLDARAKRNVGKPYKAPPRSYKESTPDQVQTGIGPDTANINLPPHIYVRTDWQGRLDGHFESVLGGGGVNPNTFVDIPPFTSPWYRAMRAEVEVGVFSLKHLTGPPLEDKVVPAPGGVRGYLEVKSITGHVLTLTDAYVPQKQFKFNLDSMAFESSS